MKIKTTLISPNKTYELRQKVLRPNSPIEECKFPLDHHPQGFHIGAYEGEKLVGIASFHPEHQIDIEKFYSKNNIPQENLFRLRGMATLPEYQGKGVGKELMLFAFAELKKRQCNILWCNARKIAYPFYEKLGFQYNSEEFDMGDIGPHKVMSKQLSF